MTPVPMLSVAYAGEAVKKKKQVFLSGIHGSKRVGC
jgi:hypothetical protein